jgi:hypothetical protein
LAPFVVGTVADTDGIFRTFEMMLNFGGLLESEDSSLAVLVCAIAQTTCIRHEDGTIPEAARAPFGDAPGPGQYRHGR